MSSHNPGPYDAIPNVTLLDKVSLLWILPRVSKYMLAFQPASPASPASPAAPFSVSVADKKIIPVVLTFINASSKWSTSHPMYGLNWRQKISTSLLHTIGENLNYKQEYWVSTFRSTKKASRSFSRFNRIAHREVVVAMPTDLINAATGKPMPSPTLHFLKVPGTPSTGKTFLYCHGGGYLYAMRGDSQAPLAMHFAKSCRAANLVILEYTLTPFIRYPGHLAQTVEAVRHLIENENISPPDIIVGGDSAGGHMTATFLTHLAEPCPGIRPLDLRGQQLCAAVMISPWLTMDAHGPSAVANEPFDFLPRYKLAEFIGYLKPELSHVWAAPVEARNSKAVWSKAFPRTRSGKSFVGRVLVTAGELEVLFSGCQTFASDYLNAETVVMDGKKANEDKIREGQVVFAVGPMEVHVQPGLDMALRYFKGGSITALTTFFESL